MTPAVKFLAFWKLRPRSWLLRLCFPSSHPLLFPSLPSPPQNGSKFSYRVWGSSVGLGKEHWTHMSNFSLRPLTEQLKRWPAVCHCTRCRSAGRPFWLSCGDVCWAVSARRVERPQRTRMCNMRLLRPMRGRLGLPACRPLCWLKLQPEEPKAA